MVSEISFSGLWEQATSLLAKYFTLCSIYRSNQLLWKIYGVAQINFDCFAIDESNQVEHFQRNDAVPRLLKVNYCISHKLISH